MMRARLAPVIAAAAVIASAEEAEEVTQPASAPVIRAIKRQAARCKVSISKLSWSASAVADATSGAATFAPTIVGVPIALITRVSPNLVQISIVHSGVQEQFRHAEIAEPQLDQFWRQPPAGTR